MNKPYREIEIEKDGIVHVLNVDENGKPVKKENIHKPKKNLKWGKFALILFLVILSRSLIYKISVSDFGFLDTLVIVIMTDLIYHVVEKTEYNIWRKFLYIILIYVLADIGMFLISRIFYWFVAVLVP